MPSGKADTRPVQTLVDLLLACSNPTDKQLREVAEELKREYAKRDALSLRDCLA